MAYVKVLEGNARWSGDASFKTFVFGVIRNTAAEHRRSGWLRGVRLDRFVARLVSPARPRDPETAAAESESGVLLRAALEKLSARQRQVLHLVFYQGLTLDETAEVLGVAPGTVRLHYERGKQHLRGLLPAGVRT